MTARHLGPSEGLSDAEPIRPADVDALVFDLGGVVQGLDFQRVTQHWANLSGQPADVLHARFGTDTAYEQHERGEISSPQYFDSLRALLGVDLSADELASGWNLCDLGLVPGIVDLLGRLAKRRPLHLLTNTNEAHEAHWSLAYASELTVFRSVFASWRMGARKPEPELFTMVTAEVGVPVGRLHLFDDSPTNVAGARVAGMPATLARSPADIARIVHPLLAAPAGPGDGSVEVQRRHRSDSWNP
jgi:HAD superfamily hydrolase (TIGR01509 family)